MNEPTKIKWQMAGEEVGNCNCSWGCPCQFNALPTTGHCEALIAWQIATEISATPDWTACVSLAFIGGRERYMRATACGSRLSTKRPARSSATR